MMDNHTKDLMRRIEELEKRVVRLSVREPSEKGFQVVRMKVMSEQEDTLTCRTYTYPDNPDDDAIIGTNDIIVAKPRILRRTWNEDGLIYNNRTFVFTANDEATVSAAGEADEYWKITPAYDEAIENLIWAVKIYDGVEVDFTKVQWLDMNIQNERKWGHQPQA